MENCAFLPFAVSLREMNNRSFEDCERTLEEVESFFFYTIYIWTAAFFCSFSPF